MAPERDGEDVGDLEQQARERPVRVLRKRPFGHLCQAKGDERNHAVLAKELQAGGYSPGGCA